MGTQNSKIIKKIERRFLKREALIGNDIRGEDIKLSGWCTLLYVGAISEKLGRIMSKSGINVSFLTIEILNG